ncbi:hemerythrin domain-containing protein [Lapillicoccus sp.]|uniref:hemerythrin domain-containing protein n=1 Tax=Lapillicoccus sp. TaxID=1909287 RepID=UPI0027C80703|nr:hemerythrin domain-containing protein [Actinomycetota bacterium]
MDVTEVILHQHAEQRRMFAMIEEWPRDDEAGLDALWKRLEILLEVHADAEERFFYPELVRLGTGGGDAPSAQEEVEDAIKDHNEIRDGIRAVRRCEAGSDKWYAAVLETNVANSDHMAEEERQDLTDFRHHASLTLRHDLAVQFLRYESQHWARGVKPVDKDPEEFVEEHEA